MAMKPSGFSIVRTVGRLLGSEWAHELKINDQGLLQPPCRRQRRLIHRDHLLTGTLVTLPTDILAFDDMMTWGDPIPLISIILFSTVSSQVLASVRLHRMSKDAKLQWNKWLITSSSLLEFCGRYTEMARHFYPKEYADIKTKEFFDVGNPFCLDDNGHNQDWMKRFNEAIIEANKEK